MNLGFRLAETRVVLSTPEDDFLRYCRGHFGDACEGALAGSPDVEVQVEWEHPTAARRPRPPLADYAHWDAYSKGFRVLGDRLVWWPQKRFPNLELETRWDGARLFCRARFFLAPTWQEERDLEQRPARRAAVYRDLTFFLFYYPALWRRAVLSGVAPLHAAAVVHGERGIVFAGAAGCGKSTLALLLSALPGWRVLSENLCLTDGSRLWACREPIVLKHPDLAAILAGQDATLRLVAVDLPLGQAGAVGHAPPGKRCDEARAERLLFPMLTSNQTPRRLSPNEARRHLAFSLRNCWEMEGYYRYASAMDLHYGTDGAGTAPLERLLLSAPVDLYPVDAGMRLEESQRKLLEFLAVDD